jgi:hypothetical protein
LKIISDKIWPLNSSNHITGESNIVSVKYFEDISGWKLSRELSVRIWKIRDAGKFLKVFSFKTG